MDPRVHIIEERLKDINHIIAVSGGKGGIGKSTLAVTLALTLRRKGHRVGLLDLDFWGPCVHVMLGVQGVSPEEEKGIVPPNISGIQCMSIAYYTAENALALRRVSFQDAVIELLAVTQWGELDYLIIDMPPGIGDVTLDVVRLMKKVNFCIVATSSKVVMETVKKTLQILTQLNIPVIGVIHNMKAEKDSLKEHVRTLGVPFLGEVPFDFALEVRTLNRLIS